MDKARAAAPVEGLIRAHKVDGRCIYDKKAKEQLVRACLEPGVSIAASALANGVNANLLRKWIDKFTLKRSASARIALTPKAASALVPVEIREVTSAARASAVPLPRSARAMNSTAHAAAGCIELEYQGIRLVIRGHVHARQLHAVLTSIKRSTQ